MTLGLGILGAPLGAWATPAAKTPQAPSGAASVPTMTGDPQVDSTNGALQLHWSGEAGRYEVELDDGTEARVVYEGRAPSAHVSGLNDGRYTLRVRAGGSSGWSAWSDPKTLTVRHHSMSLVVTLLVLGALGFASTAGLVLYHAREAR